MEEGKLNKKKLLDLVATNKQTIRGFGVSHLGLFGSFARNEQNEKSDIDFLVDFEPDYYKYHNFIELAYYLEKLFNRKVEVVTRKGLSPYMGPKILSEVENIPL
jgi:predicted nucleotidyltransferase